MKWYKLDQNNSGGHFTVNDIICHRLFVQAKNPEEAKSKFEKLGAYWNGVRLDRDCDCCGDRWYWSDSYNEVSLKKGETIRTYAQDLANQYGWTKPDCRIFYNTGKIVEIFSKKKGLSKDS